MFAWRPAADFKPADIGLSPPLAVLDLDGQGLEFGDISATDPQRYVRVGQRVAFIPLRYLPRPATATTIPSELTSVIPAMRFLLPRPASGAREKRCVHTVAASGGSSQKPNGSAAENSYGAPGNLFRTAVRFRGNDDNEKGGNDDRGNRE